MRLGLLGTLPGGWDRDFEQRDSPNPLRQSCLGHYDPPFFYPFPYFRPGISPWLPPDPPLGKEQGPSCCLGHLFQFRKFLCSLNLHFNVCIGPWFVPRPWFLLDLWEGLGTSKHGEAKSSISTTEKDTQMNESCQVHYSRISETAPHPHQSSSHQTSNVRLVFTAGWPLIGCTCHRVAWHEGLCLKPRGKSAKPIRLASVGFGLENEKIGR